jgi:hypothetical protein
MKLAICPLCEREAPRSKHHLTPRSVDKRKKKRKKLKHDDDPVALAGTCVDCHRKVHSLYDNKTLAAVYETLEKLREAPGIPEWLGFIKKKPGSVRFGSRASNSKQR